MGVEAYNSTPASNTTLASTSLAEGQTRQKDLNDQIRQILADIKSGVPLRLTNVAAVNALDNTASTGLISNTIIVDQLGLFYYDSGDSSTADDGETVLVTASGERYKIFGHVDDMVPNAEVPTELTIATGAIVPTLFAHSVDTESDASSDDLDTITLTNIPDGTTFALFAANTARTVVLKHGTGNIYLPDDTDISLTDDEQMVWLRRSGSSVFWAGGYIPLRGTAGTGTTVRTFGDRFADMANIMDFGGNYDGSTENQTAYAAAKATGKPVFFPPLGTGGSYHFTDHHKPDNGDRVSIIGIDRERTIITSDDDINPIFCDAAAGLTHRIAGLHVEGVTFDGQHVRTSGNFPDYASDTGGMNQAINGRAYKGAGQQQYAVVKDCTFKRTAGLPLWLADWDSVKLLDSSFYKTKDVGILYSENVTVMGCDFEHIHDSAISISRANKFVNFIGNTVKYVKGSGVAMLGINNGNNGESLTLTGGSTWAALEVLTISATDTTFTSEDIGSIYTLRSGANTAEVEITVVASGISATCIARTAIHASLQATATADWDDGPIIGPYAGAIANNTFFCCGTYGTRLTGGPRGISVSGNKDILTGLQIDSERSTTGGIVGGTTNLEVASTTGFQVNDWVLIEPDYTMEEAFAALVTAVPDGDTLTLAVGPDNTIQNATVWRARRESSPYGHLLIGEKDTLNYAEYIEYFGNTSINASLGGFKFGSSSGSVRYVRAHNNRVHVTNTDFIHDTNHYGFRIDDISDTSMRTSRVQIVDNEISGDATKTKGVYYTPVDDSNNSHIHLGPNHMRNVATTYEVNDGSDITNEYKPISYDSALPIASLTSTKALGLESSTATFTPTTGTDAAMTATDRTLTSASNPFTADMEGCAITVEGAGTAGADHTTYIYSYTSAGEVELFDAAVTTVSGENFTIQSGALTVTSSASSYNPSVDTYVTSIDFSGIFHETPLLGIRNAASSTVLKFIHDGSSLRLSGGQNLTLPGREAATFLPVTTSAVQEYGNSSSVPRIFGAFSASTAAADLTLSGSDQVLTFNAEDWDTDGAFDPGTGTYTAQRGGLYEFSWTGFISNATASDRIEWTLKVNGVVTKNFYHQQYDTEFAFGHTCQVQLKKGYAVTLTCTNHNNAGKINLASSPDFQFTGRMIGEL